MLVLLSLRFRFLFHDVCFSKCLEIWGCLLLFVFATVFPWNNWFPRQTDSSLLFSPSLWSISGITVIFVGILPCILDSDFSLLFSPSWLVFAAFLNIFQCRGHSVGLLVLFFRRITSRISSYVIHLTCYFYEIWYGKETCTQYSI